MMKLPSATDIRRHVDYLQLRYARHLSVTIFIAAAVLLTASVYIHHATRPYTSDDVIIQTILHQHLKLEGEGTAWLGEDNFIIKAPIYFLTDALFVNSRAVIFGTVLFFDLLGLALYMYSAFYFLRRFGFLDVPSRLTHLWLISIGTPLALYLINPNLRNLEIGISFLTLAAIARYTDGGMRLAHPLKRLAVLAACVCLGLFFYSDPFFTYMLGLPLLLFLAARIFFDRPARRLIVALLFVVEAIFFSELWKMFFHQFGIVNRPAETFFISYADFWPNVSRTIDNYFALFSADFWSRNILAPGTLIRLINLALLLAAAAIPWLLILSRNRRLRDPWLYFWLAQPLLVTAIFVLSNNTVLNRGGATRFLILAPFYFPLLVAVALKALPLPRLRYLMLALLVLGIVGNIFLIFRQFRHLDGTNPNEPSAKAIRILEDHGIQKGYAGIWEGNINTYLSDYRIQFIRSECWNIQYWLINDKAVQVPAERSFYLYNKGNRGICDEKALFDRLGQPAKTVPVTEELTLFLFDYDITGRMGKTYYY